MTNAPKNPSNMPTLQRPTLDPSPENDGLFFFDDAPPSDFFPDELHLLMSHLAKRAEEFDEEAYHKKMLAQLEETDLAEFFGNTGPLAQQLDGYELRPSQLAMAEAVKRTLHCP